MMIIFLIIMGVLIIVLGYLGYPKLVGLSYYSVIVSPESFCSFINSKKCKNTNKILNFNNKMQNRPIKLRKINRIYKTLKLYNMDKNIAFLKEFCNKEQLDFASKKVNEYLPNVITIIKNSQNYLQNNNQKFRAIDGNCIIEILANSMSFKVVHSKNFNAISSFNNIKNTTKIYKKEEQVFWHLFVYSLIGWLVIFSKDVIKFNKQILVGAKVKSPLKQNNKFLATYGAVAFNNNWLAILREINQFEIKKSVSKTLMLYEDYKAKFQTIFSWLFFLKNKGFLDKV